MLVLELDLDYVWQLLPGACGNPFPSIPFPFLHFFCKSENLSFSFLLSRFPFCGKLYKILSVFNIKILLADYRVLGFPKRGATD